MTTTTAGEVTKYLDEVRALLGDLPEDERNELLDDLEVHLREVAAESGPDRWTRALLPELVPGWWVLRGYLAVDVLVVIGTLLAAGAIRQHVGPQYVFSEAAPMVAGNGDPYSDSGLPLETEPTTALPTTTVP